ncbi:cupin domain-containing protein [Xenorhabdus thailandensis]|uniref:cupin domain-containing protein n=1 Tax=Xenorhabdus thailandensis TaxID=3136255 RepID=UPI0030F48006
MNGKSSISKVLAITFTLIAGTHCSTSWAKEPTATIITAEEGEQLTRRWGYPLTIKVDPITTGAKNFSVGTEDIPPGKAIPRHRHTHSEELIIVQSGSVIAHIGNEKACSRCRRNGICPGKYMDGIRE